VSAVLQPIEVHLEPLTRVHIEAVMQVEQSAYAHPWTRTNFSDALVSGYEAQLLMAQTELLGYFVAMQGVDEVHLLNITVAPNYQRQGWSRVLLEALALWTRGLGKQWLWLEVRLGNARAIAIYEKQGFRRVGMRKNYYPSAHGAREDALVMSLRL
jgi:[ribosomal protein S18]-alanine N-acetyltransferase